MADSSLGNLVSTGNTSVATSPHSTPVFTVAANDKSNQKLYENFNAKGSGKNGYHHYPMYENVAFAQNETNVYDLPTSDKGRQTSVNHRHTNASAVV